MTEMAIFQDVDKCMRCNGCVISCKREWQMKADSIGEHKVAADQRLAIKSQKRVDMGPFVRFSCWHCPDPPCVKRCPFDALTKHDSGTTDTGAVSIDPTLCNPNSCDLGGGRYPCQIDCQRGGFPKIGVGSDLYETPKAWKCTLCYGRAGSTAQMDSDYGEPLPTRRRPSEAGYVVEMAHEPACVYTCPAKAMEWDTRAAIRARIVAASPTYISRIGDGSVIWASKKYLLVPPKADPFVEDHVSPMMSSVLNSPFARAAIVPTLIAGGLLAISARRVSNERDVPATLGEV